MLDRPSVFPQQECTYTFHYEYDLYSERRMRKEFFVTVKHIYSYSFIQLYTKCIILHDKQS